MSSDFFVMTLKRRRSYTWAAKVVFFDSSLVIRESRAFRFAAYRTIGAPADFIAATVWLTLPTAIWKS